MITGLGRVEQEFRLGLGLEVMAMITANNVGYGLVSCLEARDKV